MSTMINTMITTMIPSIIPPSLLAIAGKTSLVIETNNLQGGNGGQQVIVQSLQRLLHHLSQQTLPLKQLYDVVITHSGIDADACQQLCAACDFSLRFTEIPAESGYYYAKNAGFAGVAEQVDYIVFADSDCIPADIWLESLLTPFSHRPDLAAVSGRTSYHSSVFGSALTTIDFKYYSNPRYLSATRNFYANNVVFSRHLFAQEGYQSLARTYRGHCQVLGLKLEQSGVEIHFVPEAHTVHRLPDSLVEVVQLRWMRGQDTCSLTPYLVRRHFPTWMQWFAKTGPIAPLFVLWCRLFFSFTALNHQSLPPLKGWRRLAGYLCIVAVSTIDMAGALVRGLSWNSIGKKDGDSVSLSYHR